MDQDQSIFRTTDQELHQSFSSKLPLILVGLLLIFAAGAGGVYLGRYFYGPKAPVGGSAPTQATLTGTPTATPTVDPTAGWKTFERKPYFYSIKIPADWEAVRVTDSDSIYGLHQIGSKTFPITINAQASQGATLDELINDQFGKDKPRVAAMVNDQIMVKIHNDVSPYVSDVYFGGNGKLLYSLGVSTLDGDYETKNHILSTFQFTDSGSSQNYTCPANGYVNCMPVIESSRQWQCGKTYLDWVRKNCPDFKGVTQ